MPRYFFDVYDDGVGTTGFEGVELEDLAAARHMAARTLSEIALDTLPEDGLRKELAISVRDETGRQLRVTLTFAAEITR